MEVELDVFSGRPNPSWSLSPAEEEELLHRLSGLPPTDSVPNPPDLGFRGFRIVEPRREIRVVGGTVTISDEAGTRVLADTGGMERWLAARARDHGYGSVVDG